MLISYSYTTVKRPAHLDPFNLEPTGQDVHLSGSTIQVLQLGLHGVHLSLKTASATLEVMEIIYFTKPGAHSSQVSALKHVLHLLAQRTQVELLK